ncbi:phenylpyruvate tautomerase MIF-related protein [Dendronalium sp. ChiSLP03b]|uniref:phenylpyruvate tautomerase MIF-related protein n=1 Tax=Dendronalium sp. ChiSLP03b TaxID=3075381 RepID=UPI002AD20974|nr:phenylpyruvate tautomerase MIF-related protein [Dendronalium sp. ChiSLP03b]MDZ8209120.1 phenylpyruvate tautomerase MIF-related protein [Dendronalium sp. ChiSLP03b]
MPFIRIETNHDFSSEVIHDVITQITEQVHIIKGDPQSMILVVVNTKVNVAFGGDYEKPAAVVQVMNLRMSVEITTKLIEIISDILLAKFNVSANRMYMFFQEYTKMHLVGWNRTTFEQILGADNLADVEAARKESAAANKKQQLNAPGVITDMSNLIQRIIAGEVSLEEYTKTEKERLVYNILSDLPLDSLLKIKQELKGNVIAKSRRAFGKVVHRDSLIPIPNLSLELWDRDPFGSKDYLGIGETDKTGQFEIFYNPKAGGFGDAPDLELRIFNPPQNVVIDSKKSEVRNLIEVKNGTDNVTDDYDFGFVQILYYEYDPQYPLFSYSLPDSIRHDFVPEALARTMQSVAKYNQIMDRLIQINRRNPHEPSYDEIQKSFPETLTLILEKDHKGYTRSDEFFGKRILNGFNPVILKKDKNNPSLYTTAFNGDKFTLTGKIDLPNYKVKFELKDGKLLPVEITLQFREDNCLQPNPPLKAPQTYTSTDGNKWLQAKRVVRATHLGVLGEVKGHLSQCHFNMEQYAIAFLRNIRNNPLRGLLYPHLKEVVHINKFGRQILMNPIEGFFAKLEPMIIDPDMLRWVRTNIGTYDWTDWQPRKPLCEGHTFAKLGNLYWDILTTHVESFFATNQEEIAKNWTEILNFSNDLVQHSVLYVPLSMEQVDDGDEWYDLNEIEHSSNPRQEVNGELKAIRPITISPQPTEQDIANIKQVCKYVIYQCTFWHTWIHNEHNSEFGELKYGDLLTNGSMGDEDDESVLPGRQVASIILAVTNMLTNFNYGYILKNEDGDVPPELIKLIESKKAEFEKLGFDLATLRSRLNS